MTTFVTDRQASHSATPPCPKPKPAMAAGAAPSPAPPRILLAGDAHGRLHQLFKRVNSVSVFPHLSSPPPPRLLAGRLIRVSVRAGESVDGAVPRAALCGAVLLPRGRRRRGDGAGGRRGLPGGARRRAHPDLLHRRLRPYGAPPPLEGRFRRTRIRAWRHPDMPQPLLAQGQRLLHPPRSLPLSLSLH